MADSLSIPEAYRQVFRRVVLETKAPGPELAAIARLESGWNPSAVGDNGHSIGLTQLHDEGLGSGMSVEEREDPYTNLSVAGRALAARYRSEGSPFKDDLQRSIAAHNAGTGQVVEAGDKWRKIARGSVGKYVDNVQAVAEQYRDDVTELLIDGAPALRGKQAIYAQLDSIWGWLGRLDDRKSSIDEVSSNIRASIGAIKDHLLEVA